MSSRTSAIYTGEVVHKRLKPRHHRLRYSVFTLLLDLAELPTLDRELRLFSWNRFNLFSFRETDHGPGDASGLEAHVRSVLAGHGLDLGAGRITLLCYPRVLGYVFNPLSVYFCHDEDDALRALVYEVSNTFGARRSYVVPVDADTDGTLFQDCQKQLYVSPFISVSGRYTFHVVPPERTTTVGVAVRDEDGPVLKAHFAGQRKSLTDGALLRLLVRYPLMTVKVIAAIHYEALKLWLKGVRTVARPDSPTYEVAYVSPRHGEPSHGRT